jgi:hypothetical protein
MKKFKWICLLLMCGSVLAAQEAEEKKTANLSAYGQAIWMPVYRADFDGLVDTVTPPHGEGPGFGIGAGGWNGVGAAVGLKVWGSDENENIGYELRMKPVIDYLSGEGIFKIVDNMAYLWARPFDMLKVQFGMFSWGDMQGKIGGLDTLMGSYGGWEDDIFQPVDTNTFGALFVLTPPPAVPDMFKGLTLFASFGVSGWLDITSGTYAARAGKLFNFVMAGQQSGIAYQSDAFGLARLQYIGSNYHWGQGVDWATHNVPDFWLTTVNSLGWFPRRVREAPQLEFAVNITAIPNLNLDIGFGYPFRVTVPEEDPGLGQNNAKLGPTYGVLGYRSINSTLAMNERLAVNVGDVWQPPLRFSAGLDYKMPELGLSIRFHTTMKFGEEIAFSDGSPNYKAGLLFEAGFEPSYTVGKIGTVSLDLALRVKGNDIYKGKRRAMADLNTLAIHSINHNGTVDLGLGAFFTRIFKTDNYIKAGVCMNLPAGGDRYNWSIEGVTIPGGDRLTEEWTQAYKKGSLIVEFPIIIVMNL